MYHGAAVLPAAANGLVKMLRLLMRLAIALQWRTDDPTSGVALYATRAGGHHTWVEHEIARYLEVHGLGTLARRAMLLTLYTGAARADAVKLGWQNVRDGRLTYRRQKTGKAKVDLLVDITIHPDLAAELADCPPGASHLPSNAAGPLPLAERTRDVDEQLVRGGRSAGMQGAWAAQGHRPAARREGSQRP
jgi:hypothetical protein